MCYSRDGEAGGISMEYRLISEPGGPGQPQLSKGGPLKYSERLKTLKSFTKDQPLPNKVVEWFRFKCLALLAVPRCDFRPSVYRTGPDCTVQSRCCAGKVVPAIRHLHCHQSAQRCASMRVATVPVCCSLTPARRVTMRCCACTRLLS